MSGVVNELLDSSYPLSVIPHFSKFSDFRDDCIIMKPMLFHFSYPSLGGFEDHGMM